jgi:hypothetical protein
MKGLRTNKLAAFGWASSIAFMVSVSAVSAAVSSYLSPEDLSARAPLVVEATVARTGSGLDPETGALNTYITLSIDRVHRGPANLAEVVVREPGGRWGDLIHEVDAVPVYLPGERVYAYLEPGRDGSLRTVGMFFGKFRLEETAVRGPLVASRDLDGQGTIRRRPGRRESLTLNDLVALTATVPQRPRRRTSQLRQASAAEPPAWNPRPSEWDRLLWDSGGHGAVAVAEAAPSPQGGVDIRLRRPVPEPQDDTQFVAFSSGDPTRWNEADNGTPVLVHVEPGGNPLNDDQAAVDEIDRALAAWTNVPQSRIHLALGNPNLDYTGQHASPASNYSGVNIVLFDDPYDDISDSTHCGGVLAIGGYWRSGSSGVVVNNVNFHPALQMYVIFNNGFECFLADPDNLAEIATHEIGHGIGFGHSNVADAIMRSSAYGTRGPRLGGDDVDAAHCHYPHTLALLSPSGNETWTANETQTIAWTVTPEAGNDPGTVDLEYSTDGGSSWKSIVAGTANDGSYAWTVADDPANDVRVRVVRPPLTVLGAPYPSACSEDMVDGPLRIAAAPAIAGSSGNGLTLQKIAGGSLRLSWSPSCSSAADDYAIYEGSLALLRAGSWDHAPVTCSAGTDLMEDIVPRPASSYYLVAPRAADAEGSLGSLRDGPTRPQAAAACAVREPASCGP